MGLADRHYMRDDSRRVHLSMTALLMIGIVAAFALQEIGRAYSHAPYRSLTTAEYYLALSSEGLKHGYVWQLLTFQFLHGGPVHLLCNLLGLWFLGRFVENCVGGKGFLKIYFASGIAGGLLQASLGLLVTGRFGGPVVGASAGVCGVLAAAAMIVPDEKFLLWFVLPVRAKYVLIGSIVLAAVFIIVPSDTNIAHGAHLGGLLAGVAFMRWRLYEPRQGFGWRSVQQRQPKRKPVRAPSLKAAYGGVPSAELDDLPSEEFISREVDPILDKISAHGIQSLTERERRILEAAREKMAKQ